MVTRKPELSLVGELVSQGGTCCSLQVGHGQACLQGHPQHLQFHDQFTPACYEDNLKVFPSLKIPDSESLLAMQCFLYLLLPLLAHGQLGGHSMPRAHLVPGLPLIYPRPVFYHGGVQHPEIWSLGPILEKLLKFSCPEVFFLFFLALLLLWASLPYNEAENFRNVVFRVCH